MGVKIRRVLLATYTIVLSSCGVLSYQPRITGVEWKSPYCDSGLQANVEIQSLLAKNGEETSAAYLLGARDAGGRNREGSKAPVMRKIGDTASKLKLCQETFDGFVALLTFSTHPFYTGPLPVNCRGVLPAGKYVLKAFRKRENGMPSQVGVIQSVSNGEVVCLTAPVFTELPSWVTPLLSR